MKDKQIEKLIKAEEKNIKAGIDLVIIALQGAEKNAFSEIKKAVDEALIKTKIKKSFSPALGFGSSAALITAISYSLFVFVHGKTPTLDDKFLWKKIILKKNFNFIWIIRMSL